MALLGEKISLITTAADRYAALAVAWIRPTANAVRLPRHPRKRNEVNCD